MFCNKCGNKIEPNSTYCTTCGNAINTTIVPQTDNTVVPTNNTVVPQNSKSSVTVASIIVVLVVFICAGVVGILFLKNTKASTEPPKDNTQIAMDNVTTAIATTTKKTANWANVTSTSQRVDIEEKPTSYRVNGVDINIPDGYTPTYSKDILTAVETTTGRYYLIEVLDGKIANVDLEEFKNSLIKNDYIVNSLETGTYMNRNGVKLKITYSGFDFDCYLLDHTDNKVVMFLFDKTATYEYETSIVNYSLK